MSACIACAEIYQHEFSTDEFTEWKNSKKNWTLIQASYLPYTYVGCESAESHNV